MHQLANNSSVGLRAPHWGRFHSSWCFRKESINQRAPCCELLSLLLLKKNISEASKVRLQTLQDRTMNVSFQPSSYLFSDGIFQSCSICVPPPGLSPFPCGEKAPGRCFTPTLSSANVGRWPRSGWRPTGTRSWPRLTCLSAIWRAAWRASSHLRSFLRVFTLFMLCWSVTGPPTPERFTCFWDLIDVSS